MTKITQDTELKAGMKVTFNNQVFLIYGMEEVPKKRFGLMDIETSLISVFNVQKCDLISILVRNKAELIEENTNVVSEYIARKLEKAKRDSIVMENGKLKAHTLAWKLLGSLSTVDVREEGLSLQKIVKICEDTTIFKNGWEVEKPKRWRAEENKMFWYVDSLLECTSTFDRRLGIDVKLYESGNYFETQEEAKEKAKQIRDVFKGEE